MSFVSTLSSALNTAIGELLANDEALRSSFSGTSFPVTPTPVEGQFCYRTDLDELYAYSDPTTASPGWYRVVLEYAKAALDLNDNQLKNARIENTTSDPTPGSGTVGHVEFRTDQKYITLVKDASTLAYLYPLDSADFQQDYRDAADLSLDATNPPTPATIGTTPTVRGLEFNATNELASARFLVPAGFVGGVSPKVRAWFYLANAEDPSDTIDATLNWVCAAAGETPNGTSSSVSVSQSISTNNAQYQLHVVDFTIAYNDANNPPAAGDLLEVELNLNSVASVAGVILGGLALLTPVKKLTEV